MSMPAMIFVEQALTSGELAKRAVDSQLVFFRQLVVELATEKILHAPGHANTVKELSAAVAKREIDPYTAAEQLLVKVNVK